MLFAHWRHDVHFTHAIYEMSCDNWQDEDPHKYSFPWNLENCHLSTYCIAQASIYDLFCIRANKLLELELEPTWAFGRFLSILFHSTYAYHCLISSGCGWLGIASWPVSWYIKIHFFYFFLFAVKGRDVTAPDWSLTKSKWLVLSRMIISDYGEWSLSHDDVIKWKHFPCYWPFVLVTVHRWIPLTNASDAEVWCFPWSAPE